MTYAKPIGQLGQPWGPTEKSEWLNLQCKQRSYETDVIAPLRQLPQSCVVSSYGELYYQQNYSLMMIKSAKWIMGRPTLLITGGVHGYETSGVQGAIMFAREHMQAYQTSVNIVIAPCVSPWGYEHIQRWNPDAIDPNRSFHINTPSPEAGYLRALANTIDSPIVMHIDLHETTDSDEQEFRPALAARDGQEFIAGQVPDGFYCVGDSENPQLDFQQAVIDSVRRVTHIAPADDQGQIIGSEVIAPGTILYPMHELGLCGSLTDAPYHTTTEVYPDSPQSNPEICNQAQVAAVIGGLEYVLLHL